MDNYYWQIYLELEKELDNIIFTISFTKEQHRVYSPRISELIVRAGTQIESISQHIYANVTKRKQVVNFKTAIAYFDKKWKLSQKYIIIETNKINPTKETKLYVMPFGKMVYKESYNNGTILFASKQDPTIFSENIEEKDRCKAYSWENAYNNLKHNFYGSIKQYGNIYNLLETMAALYVLNLYFDPDSLIKNTFQLDESLQIKELKKSNVFSIIVQNCYIDDEQFIVDSLTSKNISFDNCVYINVQSINLLKERIEKILGSDWEILEDSYAKYEIPEYINKLFPRIKTFTSYSYIIRNQIKEKDLKHYSYYEHLLDKSNSMQTIKKMIE